MLGNLDSTISSEDRKHSRIDLLSASGGWYKTAAMTLEKPRGRRRGRRDNHKTS